MLLTSPSGIPRKPKSKHKDTLGSINVEKLAAKPFQPDTIKANASSIVLLAEYEGSRNPSGRGQLGSCASSRRCRDFLVSTNGKIYNHPDPEAIARVIKHGDSPRFISITAPRLLRIGIADEKGWVFGEVRLGE
ncbi:MAG TPA: hypothetical protein VNM92_05605 [Thermoanaerobaculia bacterium]|nr:hypothetical protein [Thermoanaerobaculia bacterium]